MSRKTRAAEKKARVEAARVKCEALVNERPDEHKITPEKIAAIPAPWIEAEGENWMDGDPYRFTESGELGMCLLLLLHKYIDPDLVVERGRLDDGVGVFLLLAKAAERFIAEHQEHSCMPGWSPASHPRYLRPNGKPRRAGGRAWADHPFAAPLGGNGTDIFGTGPDSQAPSHPVIRRSPNPIPVF